ncbi:peptidase S8 [Flavobacterium laiguense]|uniref:Peptidase S8 n=2 Tax=Flavobacterium laiguense TaxID=2169409 RepID=A0A2U1JMG7_9FLAO|nr:peptidase S8 [Flavobacterium laiguense]
MKLNYILMLSVMIMILTVSCENEIEIEPESVQKTEQQNFVPGEILIKFKDGDKSTSKTKSTVLSMIMGNVVEEINTNAMKTANTGKGVSSGELLLVSSKLGTMEAIALLKNSSEIEYAEPNWIYQHCATSNDTYFTNGSLWGMYGGDTNPANQFGSQAGKAWAAGKTGSSLVYVGVIDEGAQYSHEDLAANFWTNPYDPIDGIDNDGNGYKDDIHGWDFDKNDNSTYDGTQDDHGTHVSGTIGAVGGNGKGVAGVNWNVTIISAKFLGRRGGTTANAIKAVDYFTALKTRLVNPVNIVATNNSWGGGGFSQSLKDAIDRANTADILFIAAAGNSSTNNDVTASYPSGYTSANIIAVASITNTGALSSFSQYGATTVDIGAPGSGIYSTLPNSAGNGYGSYSGTSMATPHVTGACALYASTHPGSNAAAIKSAILSSAVATPSLNGKCVSSGRLNVSGF